jgi:hypothetical protein
MLRVSISEESSNWVSKLARLSNWVSNFQISLENVRKYYSLHRKLVIIVDFSHVTCMNIFYSKSNSTKYFCSPSTLKQNQIIPLISEFKMKIIIYYSTRPIKSVILRFEKIPKNAIVEWNR